MTRNLSRWTRNLSRTVLLTVCAQAALAQVVSISPTITGITSTANRMISYRNQEHSWQTTDGAIHIMVNQGTVATGDSLALYSSFDAGATWIQDFTLGGTDAFSTSDGMLVNTPNVGPTLLLVYGTSQATGAINYVGATYNSVAQSWTVAPVQTAFSSPNLAGSNPAFSMDTAGNFWCGFTVQDLSTGLYEELLLYRQVRTTQWINTGLVLGDADTNLQHSARPVPFNNGVGMLFADGQTLYWAYRLNGWSVTAPWVTSVLYDGLPPYNQDPYDTHYSVVADAQYNLHLTFIANQQLFYMRFLSSSGNWGAVRPMTTPKIKAAYSQTVLAGGNVILMVNNLSSVEVFQSTNGGNTFILTQALVHPPAPTGSSLYYGNPRVEAPSHALSPVPTWQQYVDGPSQGLMFFQVPVLR